MWLKMALGKSIPVLVFRTETLVQSHVLTFASSAHAIIIVVKGINAKEAFFSANERSQGEGKGKEEEGKEEMEREIGSEALAETEKSQTPEPGIEPGTWDPGPQQTRLILYQ